MVKSVRVILVALMFFALTVSPLSCAEREIVAQSEKDLDLDGCTETVAVEMVNGERIVETEPGPFAGERLEGFFELVVRTADGEEKSLLLNPLFFPEYPNEPMVFTDRQWEIFFADYNADGRPDCNLGQYAGSNGNVYIIVAFSSSGQPYVLPFERSPGGVFAADRAFSTRVVEPLSGGGAVFEWYDNTRGATVRETWVWNTIEKCFTLQSKAAR